MAHIVNRRGYFSLETSYRDEHGRPRKRVLAYYGKSDPRRDRMLATAERVAAEYDAKQIAEFGETGAQRAERMAREAQFSPQTFLEETILEETSGEPGVPSEPQDAQETTSPDSQGEPEAEVSEGG